MQFRVTIQCNNDTFQPEARLEISRLLKALAERLEGEFWESETIKPVILRDFNGNQVGTASFEEEES